MKLEYNEQKLNKMLETFFVLTNANICVFDCDFNVISAYGELPCFCAKIRQDENLLSKCLASDKKYADKCKNSKESVTYTCHAGIVETISPVYSDGVFLGYIIFGGLRDLENIFSNRKTIKDACEKYSLNFNEFIGYFKELPSFTHKQMSAYIDILKICIKNVLTEKMLKPNSAFFSNKILIYIQENYTERISVKELCRKFGITEKTLYQIIKKLTDKTVNNFITDLRINRAISLLQNGNLSISEIADKTGFDDYNYFIRLFKKRTGFTPLNYRKNCLNDADTQKNTR